MQSEIRGFCVSDNVKGSRSVVNRILETQISRVLAVQGMTEGEFAKLGSGEVLRRETFSEFLGAAEKADVNVCVRRECVIIKIVLRARANRT